MDLKNSEINAKNLPYLDCVVNESLRYNPPTPTTDEFKVLKDCKMGQYNFR